LEAVPSKARGRRAQPATKLEGLVTKLKKENVRLQELCTQCRGQQGKLRDLTRELINMQEAERKSLSRTLHDEVLQVLVGVDFELGSLQSSAVDSDPNLAAKVARAQRVLKSSLQAMQRFARKMRPSALDDFGLIAALEMHIGNLTVSKQIAIRLTASDEIEDLGSAQRIVLFRVAQEALENVSRHANATKVEVNIRQMSDTIVMEISDNGRAFPVEQTMGANNPKGLGLAGMKERIEMIGGTLTIQSAPGTGTTVTARIPFTPEPRTP
jgi:signal transduction histidine kinase